MNANATPLGETYLDVLKSRESLDVMLVPSEKVECLESALGNALRIIENLALFSATVDANLTAVFKHMDECKKQDAELGKCLDAEFGDLRKLRSDVVEGHFQDVAHFSRKFEEMVRHSILKQAGIDPLDEVASMAFLAKASGSICARPPGSGN